jgi:acyl-coenzyme A thioesterase PaaI-like protein
MTLSCHVSFLAGAIGEDVFGEGHVLRRGKEIVYSDVFVLNAAGKQLAQGSHIFRLFEAPGESS